MTSRDRIMLAVIAAIAICAATFMLAIKPKRDEAKTLADAVTQAETRRDAALSTLANAKQAREKVADAKVGIARLGKAVPSEEDTATILYQLDTAAKAANVDFRKLSLDASGTNPTPDAGAGTAQPTGAGLTKVPVQLTFEGDFKKLRRFIDAVNSLTTMRAGKYVKVRGRLFNAEGVSLQAAGGGFPKLTAHITAVAYTADAPKTDAAAAAAGGAAAGTTSDASTTASTANASGVAAE